MQKISRRAFFRCAVLAGGISLASWHYHVALADDPVVYKLRILHTNDHHARIEPHTLGIRSTANPPLTRSLGGVARRKTLIDQIRAAAPNENILLLDAGDIFQGTLYFSQYNGLADLYFYNNMHYDAVAVGNHEFDRGQGVLKTFILGANFPMLTANVDIQPDAELAVALAPDAFAVPGRLGKRLLLSKSGRSIGLFGLTPASTAVLSNPGAGISFGANLAAIAQAEVDALRQAGATYVIGLTHVGFSNDCLLAAQVRGLNAIVGGHSHSVLFPTPNVLPLALDAGDVYPTLIRNPEDKNVVVTTSWKWGTWLGDITLGFNAGGEITTLSGVIRPLWAGGLGLPPRALVAGEEAEIAPDAAFQSRIDTLYKPPITQLQATIIGKAAVQLDGDRASVRNRETNLGDLLAGLMLNVEQAEGGQLVIVNSGSIGKSIFAGDVSMAAIFEALPYENTIAHVDLTGAQLLQVLENGVGHINVQSPANSAGRFPQVCGLRFVWMPDLPAGRRILSVSVQAPSGWGQAGNQFVPLDLSATYRVVTNDFVLSGGDGYTIFTQGQNKYDTGLNVTDALIDYFKTRSPVSAQTDGRIATALRNLLPLIAHGA